MTDAKRTGTLDPCVYLYVMLEYSNYTQDVCGIDKLWVLGEGSRALKVPTRTCKDVGSSPLRRRVFDASLK